MFKTIFIMIFLFSTLYSNENILNQNQTFFLPQQGNEAKDKIVELISASKENIKIAMYNFSYKKFAKELVDASKKGVKVDVILDKEKIKEDDDIYKYFKNNGVNVIIPKKKLHTKIALFDNKILLIGSLNWTKESFEENYEILLILDDKKIINETNIFFNSFN
jgi:phosphatidylserine/phosphatidylglycerophosphate/cardiolipin synthase-like enzyme